MAGDVNGLGMEPAALSGIYAANKILGKTVDYRVLAQPPSPQAPAGIAPAGAFAFAGGEGAQVLRVGI